LRIFLIKFSLPKEKVEGTKKVKKVEEGTQAASEWSRSKEGLHPSDPRLFRGK
jgi:hypothetical protein